MRLKYSPLLTPYIFRDRTKGTRVTLSVWVLGKGLLIGCVIFLFKLTREKLLLLKFMPIIVRACTRAEDLEPGVGGRVNFYKKVVQKGKGGAVGGG